MQQCPENLGISVGCWVLGAVCYVQCAVCVGSIVPSVTEFGHHIAATASATAALDGNVREALQLLRTLAPLPAAFVDLAATAAFGPLFLALSCQTVEPTAVDFQALHIVKEVWPFLHSYFRRHSLTSFLHFNSGIRQHFRLFMQ